MKLEHHPTVMAYRKSRQTAPAYPGRIDITKLKQVALAAGADDAWIVELERESLDEYRSDLLAVMPDARSVLVMVFKLNQAALKTTAYSLADLEFKHVWTHANESARMVVNHLGEMGVGAVNIPAGFPFETRRWPGKMWQNLSIGAHTRCDRCMAVCPAGQGTVGA